MQIITVWDSDEEHIIRQEFNGDWDWSEVRESFLLLIRMIRSAEQPTGVILNTLGSSPIRHEDVIQHSRWTESIWPRDLISHVVIVTNQPVFTVLISVFKRLYPRWSDRLFTARTVDEARALIRQKRSQPGKTEPDQP